MAQKKSTGETKAKTTRSTSASGKSGAKSNKSAQTPTPSPAKRALAGFAMQAGPYIWAICALLLAVCLLAGDGIVGGAIQRLFCGLFGVMAYTLPLYFLAIAAIWRADYECGVIRWKLLASLITVILTAVLVHVFDHGADTFVPKTLWTDGIALHGGGVLGGWLGECLLRGFGKVCTLIVSFGVTFVLLLYLFGVTPRGICVTILYKIRVASENRKERLAEKRQNNTGLAARNRIREEEYAAYLREKKQKEREAKENAAKMTANPADTKHGAQDGGKKDTAKPSVYKVKRRHPTVVDIPIDEGAGDIREIPQIPEHVDKPVADNAPEDTDIPYSDPIAHTVPQAEKPVPKEEPAEEFVADGTVDERIFEEVMRRTRERVEKTGMVHPKSDTTEPEVVAQEFHAASDMPGVEAEEAEDRAPWEDVPSDADAAATMEESTDGGYDALTEAENEANLSAPGTQTVSQVLRTPTGIKTIAPENTGNAADKDLSGIFVNPEDAALLDQLSALYMQKDKDSAASLAVQRERVPAGVSEQPAEKAKKDTATAYNFPPIEILTEDHEGQPENIREELQENAVKLVETLKSFNVKTKIENISRGPTITRYELLPEPGTRVRSIVNLVDDISLNLATTGVRIEAPIPGKSAVGIEVPNKRQSTVHLRTLIEDDAFRNAKSRLTCCLGADVAGDSVYFDIAKMPHLLIAGATGMGKSVCINSLIVSLLYKAKPSEVKLILVDPKKVELSIYNGIPHLLVPVVSDPKKAAGSLSWAVGEMERRFGLIEAVGVRDLKMFNEVTKDDPDYEFLPQIVIIIDELADLMMTAPDDVEESICRLAQKARAAGMHLIIGTQRPSVDVITGLIKANIPSRIAFTVASQIDSRTIIDRGGAENLIGRGDMLFNPVGAQKPIRVQGAFVSESDVEEVVSYIKYMNKQSESYSNAVLEEIEKEAARCGVKKGKGAAGAAGDGGEAIDGEDDPMLRQALEVAVESGKISTSLIQRRLSLGYGRAAKLIDRMEQLGYVSPPDGQRPRKVLITKQEFMELVLSHEVE